MLPVDGKCYVTQEYGLTDYARSSAGKVAYKNFPGGMHPGVDFGTNLVHLPAVSVISGIVVRASLDGGWGNHVEVKGNDGWNRQYAHLNALLVKVGDVVAPGTRVGLVGSTGNSTAVHLHYGNRKMGFWGWVYRDPALDFTGAVETPSVITKKLIKSSDPAKKGVYVYNGKSKFGIPDWQTKVFFFGEGTSDIEEVSDDVLSKIPEKAIIPSMQ